LYLQHLLAVLDLLLAGVGGLDSTRTAGVPAFIFEEAIFSEADPV